MIPLTEPYEQIQSRLLEKLEKNLPKDLHYHNIRHTIDVIEQSVRIAENEKINKDELLLLKIAALYHDSGFLYTYVGHETASCQLVKEELVGAGFSKPQLDVIYGLIMATKVPQTPKTKLERIICDADLDYLGREDFFDISKSLFAELKERKFITTETEWNKKQINFFKAHHYFTDTNKKLRESKKQQHLIAIEKIL